MKENDKQSFAQDIRTLRRQAGWSLRDVEKASGGELRSGYLSQLETGDIKEPTTKSLRTLSATYGVSFLSLAFRSGVLQLEDLNLGEAKLVSPSEEVVLDLFRGCSEDQQVALIGLMRTMADADAVQPARSVNVIE